MCGRIRIATDLSVFAQRFDATPDFNWRQTPIPEFLSGADQIPVIMPPINPGPRVITRAVWGFKEGWAERPIINARAEKLLTSDFWARFFRAYRCLVPASGWFEWQPDSQGHKIPVYVQPRDKGVVAMAGLWRIARDPETRAEHTEVAIVTTPPNALLKPIHDRMPAVLGQHAAALWLSPKAKVAELQSVLRPCPSQWLVARPTTLRQMAA